MFLIISYLFCRVNLTDKLLLKSSKLDALHKITSLNLHGSGLTKLRHMYLLVNLRNLVVSFNELTRLDELSGMVGQKLCGF